MEEILNEIVPQDELKKFEKQYAEELELNGKVAVETNYMYAFCLVRSRYRNDIRRGIMILEDLTKMHPHGNRAYIYYLAFGNTRIKNYSEALKYCKVFLEIESNRQVRTLEEYIKKQKSKQMAKGMTMVGGAALLLGGILGLGAALAKSKEKR